MVVDIRDSKIFIRELNPINSFSEIAGYKSNSITETKFGAVTAICRDPSHNQHLNADTIAYTSKISLKGPSYSSLL
jgi:hypothetical protein